MGNLSNTDIEKLIKKGKILIEPYDAEMMQGDTIDFRLGQEFLVPEYSDRNWKSEIRLDEDFPMRKEVSQLIKILPHHFILGTTLEKLTLPDYISARVDGKSKIGRKGLFVQTAGHIGPGFSGEITLELYNANQLPIVLEYGRPICQIEFTHLKNPSTKPYIGQYQGQRGPKV